MVTALIPVGDLVNGRAVDAIRARLGRLAGTGARALTDAADFHLIADGRRIASYDTEGDIHRFMLHAAPSSLLLASRCAIPARTANNGDQRRLGVAIKAIVLGGDTIEMRIDFASPLLRQGFHPPEPGNGHIWTKGAAVLPSCVCAPFDGPLEVAVHIAGTTRYRVPDTGARQPTGRKRLQAP